MYRYFSSVRHGRGSSLFSLLSPKPSPLPSDDALCSHRFLLLSLNDGHVRGFSSINWNLGGRNPSQNETGNVNSHPDRENMNFRSDFTRDRENMNSRNGFMQDRQNMNSGSNFMRDRENMNTTSDFLQNRENMNSRNSFMQDRQNMNSRSNFMRDRENKNTTSDFLQNRENMNSRNSFMQARQNMNSGSNYMRDTENMKTISDLLENRENMNSRSDFMRDRENMNYKSENNGGTGRSSRPMDFVRGVIQDDGMEFTRRPVFSQFSEYYYENDADIVHIKMLRNNTFVTITDAKGNTKLSVSAGSLKDMKAGQKLSRYAAEATAEVTGRKARALGLKSVVMKVNGFTHFRRKRQAILSWREGFADSRVDRNPIVHIEDTTRKPHNGCRLPKKRRI